MRVLLALVVGFVGGLATAFSLIGSQTPSVAAVAEQAPARAAPAQRQTQRPSATGGDESFALNRNGHVETYAEIDGADMKVLIDTGATMIALRESDARRAGYRLRTDDFTVPVSTANGTKYAAPIILRSVEIGSIRIRNVEALVSRDDQLGVNLLGMTFLRRLEGFRFDGDTLVLEN
ncbi:MAG: TIGR02281 family clan AA aspartic protease [Pseudomonadota bacterium]